MQLFQFQQSALDRTKPFNSVAYYMDMGLGKTYVGSEKMMSFGSRVNLLICQKSKIKDWAEHFKSNYNEFPYMTEVFNLTVKKDLDRFMEVAKEDDSDGLDPRQFIGIINYELTFRRSQLLELFGFSFMLDESSLIQNEKAQRTKFAMKMDERRKDLILLSGTPTDGKYERLWSQIQMLGWKIKKETFMKQYVETVWVEEEDGHFRRDIVGYKNVDRLKRKLAEHGAIFMTTDEAGIELPEQIIVPVMADPSKEYRKFMKSRLVTVEGYELVGDSALTKLLYSRMLCGQYNQEKLDAFEDLITSTTDRLIVFYNFNEELNKLTAICERHERPCSVVNGKAKDLAAYEQNSDSITFIQYQAGSMGLNLQKANKTIYFTLPLSAEQWIQSHKRTHRIGQKNTCFYYYMMCHDSVEEHILDTLKMRKDYTDELFTEYDGQKK